MMNNNDDEATRFVDGGEVVADTAEVKFVPLEEDDFGVFSGGEESYYSDVEPVPVVLEEDVEIEDEGDVVVRNDDEGVEKLEDEEVVDWNGGDRRMMNRVAEDLERAADCGREENFLRDQRFTVARFWRGQVDAYEGKIVELERRLVNVTDGFKAAKRIAEVETDEVERLRKLYMDKISEAERLKETVADLVGQTCDLERKDQLRRKNNKRRLQQAQKELDEERKRRRNVEDELSVTRKRLLMFTRRSIPHRSNRVVRRIDSYEDGEESTVTLERATSDEDTRVNKLIHVMNNI